MLRCLLRSTSALTLLLALPACGSSDPAGSDTTEATGDDDDGGEGETGTAQAPTWYQDIAPIVHYSCAGCHRDGGIAPFTLEDYDSAATWSELLVTAVESGQMPPFGAASTDICEPPHGFEDDPRLSEEHSAMLRAWAEAGAPEGDPDNPAELPERPSTSLEDPDLSLTIPSAVEVGGSSDRFVCYVVDPEIDDLRFLNSVQVNPGNDKIVHHVLVYATNSDAVVDMAGDDGQYDCFGGIGVNDLSLVAAWAPGAQPAKFPTEAPGVFQGGERLVINVHYHPTGGATETDDSTSVDLKFQDGLPEYVSQLRLIGNFSSYSQGLLPGMNDTDDVAEFRIPAGEEAHVETMQWQVPGSLPDLRVWMVGAHMHYVGVDMAIGVLREEESEKENFCMLQTPNYDFNWQRGYNYDVPFEDAPVLNVGDALMMQCTYNNSMSNPYVAQALADQGLTEPVDVYLGEETLDEMCLGVFGIAAPIASFLP